MASTRAAYRNSGVSASGKNGDGRSRSLAIKLASVLTRKAGLVSTWSNIQTVRIAIESEAGYSGTSLPDAANVILAAAQELTTTSGYDFTPDWERRNYYRLNTIDRFWFEDARWRDKSVYMEWRAGLRRTEAV
jgi:hypothetical protein